MSMTRPRLASSSTQLRCLPGLLVIVIVIVIGTLLAPAVPPASAATPALLLDDYSDAKRNRSGFERLLVTDAALGSRSKATQTCTQGVLKVDGELVPGRGVPAFVSAVSLLSTNGTPRDLAAYQGVRLRVRVLRGILCVQVASSKITNFDFHTSAPIPGARAEFKEVRIAFKDLKRAWSEAVPLDPATVTSVNLVSFGTAPNAFAYEVDELGFY